MKPPVFKYHDPATLDEALDLLARYADSAKVLAGGQSLMPLLNFRLARPEHLIDLNRIGGFDGLTQDDGQLHLGAMLRQRVLERSAAVAEACAAIAEAMPLVGHAQIRNRGTLGGSLAHADPAAELPAVMLGVDAQLTLQSRLGQRTVAAEDFFVGNLVTVLRPDELLVRIDVPVSAELTGSSVQEVAMRAGDFALAGVVACVTLAAAGPVSQARIVCFGVADRPVRIREAEASVEGVLPSDSAFTEAARIVTERVECIEDIHASAAYRKRVSGTLTRRALAAALSRVAEVVA